MRDKKEKLFYNATDLYCCVRYYPNNHEMYYKFLIRKGCTNWTAYKTVTGFKQFMKVYGLEIDTTMTEIINNEYQPNNKTMLIKFKPSKFDEHSFWKIEDIPNFKICKKFVGLSNGSYVDCYYKKLKHGNVVYRPNPNAKEVYKPLSLYEHIAYSKELG